MLLFTTIPLEKISIAFSLELESTWSAVCLAMTWTTSGQSSLASHLTPGRVIFKCQSGEKHSSVFFFLCISSISNVIKFAYLHCSASLGCILSVHCRNVTAARTWVQFAILGMKRSVCSLLFSQSFFFFLTFLFRCWWTFGNRFRLAILIYPEKINPLAGDSWKGTSSEVFFFSLVSSFPLLRLIDFLFMLNGLVLNLPHHNFQLPCKLKTLPETFPNYGCSFQLTLLGILRNLALTSTLT